MIQPRSPSVCAFSCPALPAATQIARPGAARHASSQRETPLEPSCAPPLVPRLMLIDERHAHLASAIVEQILDRVDDAAGSR